NSASAADFTVLGATATLTADGAGKASAPVVVTTADDNIYEPNDENFTFNLSCTDLCTGKSAPGSIHDNDSRPTVMFTGGPEGNSLTIAATFTITVTRPHPVVTFNWLTQDINAHAGTAAAPCGDYIGQPVKAGPLINANNSATGSDSVQVTVPVCGDTVDEPD